MTKKKKKLKPSLAGAVVGKGARKMEMMLDFDLINNNDDSDDDDSDGSDDNNDHAKSKKKKKSVARHRRL